MRVVLAVLMLMLPVLQGHEHDDDVVSAPCAACVASHEVPAIGVVPAPEDVANHPVAVVGRLDFSAPPDWSFGVATNRGPPRSTVVAPESRALV